MRTFAERRLVVLLTCWLAVSLFACGRTDKAEAGARHYEARGIVRAVAPDHSTLDIEHETIPGFMPSMTMPFAVKNPPESAALHPGDAISFRLAVTDNDAWIDQIKTINAADVHLTAKTQPAPKVEAAPRLRAGGAMPPFELADQNGLPITLDTFRGRPFVLTFIFTRCPIPNFCPLMSKNFAQLQSAIKGGSGALAETKLLSISFDPEYDTPQVLRDYAVSEKADPAVWRFATGASLRIKDLTSGFSVLVQPEAGTISHSLATALVDGSGRIVEIWRGNGWKPADVIEKIKTL